MRLKIIIGLLILFSYYSWSAEPITIWKMNDKGKKTLPLYCSSGVEIIEYIPNHEKHKGKVCAILYQLENKKDRKKAMSVIKPHLYTVLAGKQLGIELLPVDVPLIYLKEKEKKIILTVDLSRYEIDMPQEGLFVGLEYLGEVDHETDNDYQASSSPFGMWHITDAIPSEDDVCYSRWKGKITSNPRDENTLCLFGINVCE